MCKICIFAGTSEGRTLANALLDRGVEPVVCVATEYGEVLLGEQTGMRVHSGRMDEKQMTDMLCQEKFDLVIDATHPYAQIVSENIVSACARSRTQYQRLLRGSESAAEDGVFVEDAAACAEYLKTCNGAILLTTGSKDLAFYRDLRDRLYVRILPMQASLQVCADCGIAPDHIIAMQGPFDEEMNLAMLKSTKAKYLVTKDTGSAGGYGAKIRTAHRAGAQAVIIGRPPQHEGLGIDEILSILEQRYSISLAQKKVSLVGVGVGGSDSKTLGMERAVREADCLIGAKRMLEMASTSAKTTFCAVNACEIADYIAKSAQRRFAVLLSGDVGFYSGAKKLLEELSKLDGVETEALAGIGSLQYFCARLQRTWEDVRAVSLHGRDCDLPREVQSHSAVFALVGGENGVHNALERLSAAGLGDVRVYVGQCLGYPNEKIVHGAAADLLGERFDSLSVMLIENERFGQYTATHGLPDEAFDRDETPMTKSEIRSISLSKLALTPRAIVYDVGSGSGSVSVECALVARSGRVYAIERNEKALALTQRNARKFGCENLEIVSGCAPEALEALPAPSHVFIGGSGGNMRDIIDCVLKKNPHARIVVNTVTLETLVELSEIAKEFDFSDVAEVSVAKARKLGKYQLMTAQNPVFIFTLQNGAGL